MLVGKVVGERVERKDLSRGSGEVIGDVVVEVAAHPVYSVVELTGNPDVQMEGAVPQLGEDHYIGTVSIRALSQTSVNALG